MMRSATYITLLASKEWDELRNSINPLGLPTVDSILEFIRQNGAKSALIEHEYLDRDFTSEFSSFYAHVFKRHRKICKRIHFFSVDVLEKSRTRNLPSALDTAHSEGHYLGFSVIRPITSAPLGRTVLSPSKSSMNTNSHVLVRAKHAAHPFGTTLIVEGAPFTQQDSRISACAHASIWVAARHLHVKHREGWFSTVDIAEFASTPTDITLASSLPAGSGGLSINNMTRALRAMGREPIVYLGGFSEEGGTSKIKWPNGMRPQDVVNRYVDSGIPVILAIRPWSERQNEGHAVVCIGHTQQLIEKEFDLANKPTRSIFCK